MALPTSVRCRGLRLQGRGFGEVEVGLGHPVEVVGEDVERHVRHDLGDRRVVEPGAADFIEVGLCDRAAGVQHLQGEPDQGIGFGWTEVPSRLSRIWSAVKPAILPMAECAARQ